MMDRERVIKGLECCDALHNGGVVMCGTECPYGIADGIDRGCRVKLIPDALALLKAQEPRVLTLEEVLATEVVYAEDVDKAEIIPVLVDRRAHDRIVLVRARLMGGPSLSIYPLISEYNKRWRCWTSRPTDVQREAIPWES